MQKKILTLGWDNKNPAHRRNKLRGWAGEG